MLLEPGRRATAFLLSLGHAIDHLVLGPLVQAAGFQALFLLLAAIAAATIALVLTLPDVDQASTAPAAAAPAE